jgi:hypothetical protein
MAKRLPVMRFQRILRNPLPVMRFQRILRNPLPVMRCLRALRGVGTRNAKIYLSDLCDTLRELKIYATSGVKP